MDPFPSAAVLEVLARYGINTARRGDNAADPTEEIILVTGEEFERTDVREATLALMKVLPGKKVWVVPDDPNWKSTPI